MRIVTILILVLSFVSIPLFTSTPLAHGSSCPLKGGSNRIEGCVIDSGTGNPISGVNVYVIDCGGFQVTDYNVTDLSGYFILDATLFTSKCIQIDQTYAVSVNGIDAVTYSGGCNTVPNCNLLGRNADNNAWSQWAGDVSTDNNGYGSKTIALSQSQVIVPSALLYSNTGNASLSFTRQTSYTYSDTIGSSVSINGGPSVQGSYDSSVSVTYTDIFNPLAGYPEYVERPYFVIGYYCAGSQAEKGYGWTCSQGLQSAGLGEPVPNSAWGTSHIFETLTPYNLPSNTYCDVPVGPGSIQKIYNISTSTTATLSLSTGATLFGIGTSVTYSATAGSGTSNTISATLNNPTLQSKTFRVWFAGGSCDNPTFEIHVWDLSTYPPPGRGGSVASGTLILTPRGEVPVQNLNVGETVVSIDPFTQQQFDSTITSINAVTVNNMLIFFTDTGQPLRVDINPRLRFNAIHDGQPGLWSTVLLVPGDSLYQYGYGWTPITRIDRIYGGQHTYFDLHLSPSHDFVANGYSDCPCKE